MNYNVECYNFHTYGYMERYCRSMMNHNVERYKCNNYGHIAYDYRSIIKSSIQEKTDIKYKKVLKKKPEV